MKRYREQIFSNSQKTGSIRFSAPVLDICGKTEPLYLDYYQGAGDVEMDRVAIVAVHGGWGIVGKRDDARMNSLCRAYARRGFAAFSVDYRLEWCIEPPAEMDMLAEDAGLDTPPTQRATDAQSDVHAAIRFLRKHAQEYRIDPERIVVTGHSFGATTAFLVAHNSKLVGTTEDTNPSNAGFASNVHASIPLGPSGVRRYCYTMQAGDPPISQQWGALDPGYPIHSGDVKQKADELGIHNELVVYDGAGHDMLMEGFTPEVVTAGSRFICAQLGL